jgi:flagellar protein FlbD
MPYQGVDMIRATKINGEAIVINCLLIEMIEATPDTVVTLSTGRKIMLRDGIDDVVQKATEYHRAVGLQSARPSDAPVDEE